MLAAGGLAWLSGAEARPLLIFRRSSSASYGDERLSSRRGYLRDGRSRAPVRMCARRAVGRELELAARPKRLRGPERAILSAASGGGPDRRV